MASITGSYNPATHEVTLNWSVGAPGWCQVVGPGWAQTFFPANSGTHTWVIALDDGTYAVQVEAGYQGSMIPTEQASSTFTVSGGSGGGGGDTTPPDVTISTPAVGATVRGDARVAATVTDAGGVASVALKVDGLDQGAATVAGSEYSWELATETWANGDHQLSVLATDVAGNSRQVTISVTVDNDLAEMIVDEAFGPFSAARGFAEDATLAIFRANLPLPTGDPRRDYRALFGIARGATQPTTWASYTPIPDGEHFGLTPNQGPYWLMVRKQPQLVRAWWDSGSLEIVRLAKADSGVWYGLLRDPDKVMTWSAAVGFEDFVTLDATGTDLAVVGDAICVAIGDHVRVYSSTSGEVAWTARDFAGDAIATVDCLAGDGLTLYAAATLTGGGHVLYSLEADSGGLMGVKRLTTLAAQATALFALNGQVLIGDAAGKISLFNGTTVTEEIATGEARIADIEIAGTVVCAGTGNGGKVYQRSSGGTWTLIGTLPVTDAKALAVFGGWLHGGGEDDALYRQAADLTWSGAYALEETAAVTGLESEASDSVEALLVATEAPEGQTARLYRYQVASGGTGLACGVGDTRFGFEILRRA